MDISYIGLENEVAASVSRVIAWLVNILVTDSSLETPGYKLWHR